MFKGITFIFSEYNTNAYLLQKLGNAEKYKEIKCQLLIQKNHH